MSTAAEWHFRQNGINKAHLGELGQKAPDHFWNLILGHIFFTRPPLPETQSYISQRIWQGIRSMTRFCSKIGWKWKWSEKCRKSEISLIWCISTTNKVKSCKKFNETAQTANFTDFLLTFCENRPKWTKTMQTQTRRVRLQKFLRGIQICHMKADVLAIPKMWWFLILHFFKPKLLLPKVGSNLKNFFAKLWRQKK